MTTPKQQELWPMRPQLLLIVTISCLAERGSVRFP